jgi:hypothetical protein
MEIYLLKNDIKLGPYSDAKIQDLLHTGLANGHDLAWHEGLTDWVSLYSIAGSLPPIVSKAQSGTLPSKGLFRLIVALSFVCLIAQIVCAYGQPLPEPLATFVNQQGSPGSIFAEIAAAIYFVAMLVAYVSLLLLKAWGRVIFAIAVGLALVLSLEQGPLVEPCSAVLFGSLSDLFTGAVLALAFLTPVLQRSASGSELGDLLVDQASSQ